MRLRSSAECALICVFANSGEGIGDHSDEQIDEPEIQHDDANDEEKAGYEELGVHHGVHEGRPLRTNALMSVMV